MKLTKIRTQIMWALIAVGLVVAAIAVGGGNTIEGFGQDVENTGAKIENKAE